MAKFTQKAIIATFLEILQDKSLDKITVKDIVEQAEINRNTFYYYYEDIYDLLDYIFEDELRKVLSEAREGCTFYEEYVRAAAILLNNKQAIRHVYQSKSRHIVIDYLAKVTEVFVKRFVVKAAEGYELDEEGVNYITRFYSAAIVGYTMHWIDEGMPEYRERLLKTMSCSFEATVDDMIRDYILHEKED